MALAYFYCCSTDPRVAIFNDQLQPDVDGSVIWNHISNLIGRPIGQEEAMFCQETFNNLDQSHARIAACASCCEHLLSVDGQQGIVEMKIDDLPLEFLLTESQKESLTTLPHYNKGTINNHRHHHYVAAALPNALLVPLKLRFRQATTSAAKLAAAAVLPPLPPLLPRCQCRATTAYKIIKKM